MKIPAKPWIKKQPPKRILAIRLQAMGDVVITLPYLQHLRNTFGAATEIDFLTREETNEIPKGIELFDCVYTIKGRRNFKKQFLYALLLVPKLFFKKYDIVIDLQNNRISKMIRKFLMPDAWSEYDRYSPIAAGERYRLTIEAACGYENKIAGNFKLKHSEEALKILNENGWNGANKLVVLNPAGAFETRNWKIENYVSFAELWLEKFYKTQFLIIGLPSLEAKANYLKKKLGNKLINLVGKTNSLQAFSILQKTQLIISEDSGLMHMAWISGIPTVALFGSTRNDWSRPLGEYSYLLDSSDLPCGNCMQAYCIFGDVHCLARHSAEEVLTHALKLLEKKRLADNHRS